jgi:hypothetical protein
MTREVSPIKAKYRAGGVLLVVREDKTYSVYGGGVTWNDAQIIQDGASLSKQFALALFPRVPLRGLTHYKN